MPTASVAERCASLREPALLGLHVEEARLVPAGPPAQVPGPSPIAAPGPRNVSLPEHCLFRGTLWPRTGPDGQHFGIGIELRLPVSWNGRFMFQGGGGLDGVLAPSYGLISGNHFPSALTRGYAVASTDGGHRSKSMVDPHFALDQQARIDYAYGALEKTTYVAKALIARFYDSAPHRSYFVGCSNGGRQAMVVAERMPLEFDGIVAGDPSFRLTRTNIDEAWNEIVLARAAPKDAQGRPIISRALSQADLRLVGAAVLRQCDGKDGLVDGMINDYRACRFDPAVLTCRAGKTPNCLAASQVTALKALMDGPHDSHGQALYAAFPYDAGIADPAFYRMHFGTSPDGVLNSADATLGFDSLRYYSMTPPDPDFDPMKFDFDRDPQRLTETAKINDADSVFLSSFAGHGKLILYHGLSDQGLSPLDTAAWYDRLRSANGGDVQTWARLFLVPGMTHCSGGPSTDEFDMLTAIQQWVENGRAPDRIVARGRSFPNETRPLCPYPTVARYTTGDPRSESSFTCK
ncbi:MAG TPA: tannase/feruloyl esterase family alpha/beta hydrolase [Steroidobacteraceae bacterium]|nr:tannase/feruloyl esterase family alpha/beta hydrolase [Steroidobacteraceae bacterium]